MARECRRSHSNVRVAEARALYHISSIVEDPEGQLGVVVQLFGMHEVE
jgi:hypothetical protein